MGFIGNIASWLGRRRSKKTLAPLAQESQYDEYSKEDLHQKNPLAPFPDDPLWEVLCNHIAPALTDQAAYGGVSLPQRNVCVATHLIFNYLAKGTTTEMLNRVINELDQVSVEDGLHQFPWDCQSLPHIIGAIIRCCTLYKEKDHLDRKSLQEISKNALKLLDHAAMPLFKRTKRLRNKLADINSIQSEKRRKAELSKLQRDYEAQQSAYNRVFQMTKDILKAFAVILLDFSEMWPKELENPLRVSCSDVPRIVLQEEIDRGDFREELREFAKQIPPAIEAFGSKIEDWKASIQFLCSKNHPNESRLCEIWYLLARTCEEDAYEFLTGVLSATMDVVFRKRRKNGHILRVEPEVAESVTGALYDLILQCIGISTHYKYVWRSTEDKDRWEASVGSEVAGIIKRRGEALDSECQKMLDYLKMILGAIADAARSKSVSTGSAVAKGEIVNLPTAEVKHEVLQEHNETDEVAKSCHSAGEKIKVLFCAANPNDTPVLDLEEEIREIETKIRASEHRDSVVMIQKWAIRYDDLHQALLQHKPHIIHFSGHGSPTNEILLLDQHGNAKPVSPERLKKLLTILKDNIRGVVFNTCYSEEQAQAVAEIVDFAVGVGDEIEDDGAILFAASFYRGIGFNRSVKEAFDLGVNILEGQGVPNTQLPVLVVREGVDPSNIYLLSAVLSEESEGQA